MRPQLLLWLVLASGLTPPAPAQTSIEVPGVVGQTIRADSSGNTQVENHSVEAGASTMRFVQPGGQVVETTRHANVRVLIEIHARPVLDRRQPGTAAESSRQRDQLALDLKTLDARLHSRNPSQITHQYQTLFSGVAATVDSSAIGEIRRLPNVDAVYDDVEVHVNDNGSNTAIGAPTVWSTYGVSGAGVKVAVIDTGVDYTHPDLGGCLGAGCKVAGGYDFVNNDNDPMDDFGHGTHVAGIIAANGVLLKGVAPGATLLAYKVLDQNGIGYSSNIIAAIEQALADHAKVANMSFGGPGDAGDPESQALDNATAAGMLSVVAAGNSGPSYLSVLSPGVARTALTVGAADDSWLMATFSSRGYVTIGSEYVMKPEVIAPGVNIYSTVPTTGPLGNPSRYATLSGTSMATPHVAGSAALLLEWDATLTPQDIKNRLARGARTLGQDPFIQGAGGIDLVAAFGLPMVTSTTSVSFGLVNAGSGVVTRQQTISVQNTASASQTFSLAADSSFPAGATLTITPPSVTLQQGQSADVTLQLRVDTAVSPEPPDPMDWSTRIAISNGTQTAHLPAFFLQGSVLNLSFDEPPAWVSLTGASGALRVLSPSSTSVSAVVKSGTWDVVASYNPPYAIVAQEQQSVQGQLALSFARGQATHSVGASPVDDTGQPLRQSEYLGLVVFGLPNPPTPGVPGGIAYMAGIGLGDVRVSDLSSRYLVALSGSGPDPSGLRYFVTGWAGSGISSDLHLPMTNVPYRRMAQTATQPAGGATGYLSDYIGFAVRNSTGANAIILAPFYPGELSRTTYLQWSVAPDLPVLPIQRSVLWGFTSGNLTTPSDFVEGATLNFKDIANIGVDRYPFFNLFDPARQPEIVLGSNVDRWDVDPPPNALPIEFHNTSTTIQADYNADFPGWMTHTLGRLARVATVLANFDLYQGGVLTGNYPLYTLQTPIPSAAGPQEVHSSSAYSIGGVGGSSQVVASFDTSKTDRDPPTVSRFRIEQNGIRTATPFYLSKTPFTVKFRATDVISLASVSLEWRQSGTTTWTQLTLGGTHPDYEAPIKQQGSIDLRVTATDSSGNSFQEQWIPALITRTAAPPGTPTSVTATRSGTSTIAVSWAPSTSDAGIAGYRIERVPGNQLFTTSGTGTSFVDSNGLVPGSAYFYRVTAVDTEDAVSAHSAYDVATLIEFADDPVTAGVTGIRGAHVADLRLAIDAVRQAAGLGQAWINYSPPTDFIRASHFLDLRDRLNEGRAAMSLPAVQLSDPVAIGATVRARTVRELRDGVK